MRSSSSLTELYPAAARATAAGSKSFYFATRFFPRPLARAAHAVYWFCRHTDDLADEATSLETAWRDIEDWDKATRSALSGRRVDHPVLQLFVDTVQRHQIPHEFPLELIEGMRMDLRGQRYRTFAELRLFCYRVASVVGLMMSHVIGYREPALGYAIDLGIAMQLTNILRDVGEDLRMGRVYLPSEEMGEFGYSADDLRMQIRNEPFRQLMRFQIARARDFYERAVPGIELLSRDGRFAVELAAKVYREILVEVEKNDFDVFGRRAVVPGYKKAGIALSSVAIPAARYSVGRLVSGRA